MPTGSLRPTGSAPRSPRAIGPTTTSGPEVTDGRVPRPMVRGRGRYGRAMATTADGRVGGRYELVRRIARGGGGTVWRGYDHLLEREVAIKHVEIPDELGSERDHVRARVRSEARAAARLVHPAGVTIFDVVDDERDVHLVLELVEWPTLADVVDSKGPVPDAQAATIGLGLLSVLEAAHERGIVHRDVKPSNIFVGDEGVVKLTDFGIAALEGEARLTRTGATMGSPSFVAPEQAIGRPAAPAADLWGLGVSLYLAVEGVPPFERNNAIATVHAVVHEPAREFERAVELREVLTTLLAKDPADRPAPARLRAALREIAGPDAPTVPEAPPPNIVPVRSSTTPAAPAAPVPETDPAAPTEPAAPAPATEPAAASEPAAREAPTGPATAASAPVTASVSGTSARDDADGGTRWRLPALVAALVALVAVVIVARPFGADDPVGAGDPSEVVATDGGTEDEDPGPGEGTAGDGTAEDGDEAGGADDADAAPPADEEADPVSDEFGPAVETTEPPADWSTVDGATYSVAVPEGWETVERADVRTDYRDPDTGSYLRVEWTDSPQPDPVANWEDSSASFAANRDGYEELELRPATFQGHEAAYWEYVYSEGGTELRAINLNVLVDDGRAYALNLQAPAEQWDEVGPLFPALGGGFDDDR
jgi:eukaryotic-like serine/threonine-protein kinase